MKTKTRKVIKRIGKAALRTGAILGTALAFVVAVLFGAMTEVAFGPSDNARSLFVVSVMQTSGIQFLAHMYFSQQQIDGILAANAPHDNGVVSVPVLAPIVDPPPAEQPDIEVLDITGPTFEGKLMLVKDPSRLFVGSIPEFSDNITGQLLTTIVANYGATAGINGGGFLDVAGHGQGGTPMGFVIQNGQFTWGTPDTAASVVGFDGNNRLVVGWMTGQQALNRGVRDALCYGPSLVVNGNRVPVSGNGGGLNPRTAIGQRADGTVLLLVIDGRQPKSLGASYKDEEDIMLQYGAVNAGNLDGGSSSLLIYNGEVISTHATIIGPRNIPDAFLVR
ncbi:MAG: phosphodiester glycosidase family protein [Oscillospiraceae bacterium]|nr:phosphodiester glycosidase family protein [Oscillospiraceae bacterium]